MHLSKAFSPSHLPNRSARQCCFLISIDIKDSNPEPFFHESPKKTAHPFRLVKNDLLLLGSKARCFYLGSILGSCQLFVGHVTSPGNFQGRWVKHVQMFRWRKGWKVEVSFQTFAEDQLLGNCWALVFFGCHCHFRLSLLQRSYILKKKKTKHGGTWTPEVGNGPISKLWVAKSVATSWMNESISMHI